MSMLHCITSASSDEKGYIYMNGTKVAIHKSMEDVEWSGSSACGAMVFILADGHGGAGAAHYFVKAISSPVLVLLDSKDWDFTHFSDRTEMQESLQNIFIQVDNDYTQLKYNEFCDWFSHDPLDTKPQDDGCTFVLNILYNGFLVNANVGDSRTILVMKSENSQSLEFSSVDHNTTNPVKIRDIVKNGGSFVSQKGTVFKIIDRDQDYSQLLGARIYRYPSLVSTSIGLSHRRTLNLTGSMGDIHFKLYPPVLSSSPDVSFSKLDESQEYVLIAATDGVWDHLSTASDYDKQNLQVTDFVFSVLGGDYDEVISDKGLPTPLSSETSDDACENQEFLIERLRYAAQGLVRREQTQTNFELFHECLPRYDDATAQIVHVAPFEA